MSDKVTEQRVPRNWTNIPSCPLCKSKDRLRFNGKCQELLTKFRAAHEWHWSYWKASLQPAALPSEPAAEPGQEPEVWPHKLSLEIDDDPRQTHHIEAVAPEPKPEPPPSIESGEPFAQMWKREQSALRAFYALFGRLALTMVGEATIEECLAAGIFKIDALHAMERAQAEPASVEAFMSAEEFWPRWWEQRSRWGREIAELPFIVAMEFAEAYADARDSAKHSKEGK